VRMSCGCSGYHWHPGKGHFHKHDEGHHGTPWGKPPKVIEVDGPDLSLLLQQSISKVEAKRGTD